MNSFSTQLTTCTALPTSSAADLAVRTPSSVLSDPCRVRQEIYFLQVSMPTTCPVISTWPYSCLMRCRRLRVPSASHGTIHQTQMLKIVAFAMHSTVTERLKGALSAQGQHLHSRLSPVPVITVTAQLVIPIQTRRRLQAECTAFNDRTAPDIALLFQPVCLLDHLKTQLQALDARTRRLAMRKSSISKLRVL
jgi:hypothetical protein